MKTQRELNRHRPLFVQPCPLAGHGMVWLVITLLLSGCSLLPERQPLTEERYAGSKVLGMTGLRHWADESPHITSDLPQDPSMEELRAVIPGLVDQELRFLAISGGGENGAFAAGLLNGWTRAGGRPEFNIVTGISAGALIAPFAFLGPAYDPVIQELFTQYSTDDLIRSRYLVQILRSDAAFSTDPLRALIAKYMDDAVMEAIAAEYQRGRWLFIGTTNLDAGNGVIWDIGAIASSGRPGALDLIHDVLLASASIPVAFPPVMIEVEVEGQVFDEMHVDGGVSRQSFLFELSTDPDSFKRLNIVGIPKAYFIFNSQLESAWEAVDRRVFSIAERSVSAIIRTQGVGDIYREYLATQKFGFDFNLASIPTDFEAENHEMFDRGYMQALYKLGYDQALGGYPWQKSPPGLESQ